MTPRRRCANTSLRFAEIVWQHRFLAPYAGIREGKLNRPALEMPTAPLGRRRDIRLRPGETNCVKSQFRPARHICKSILRAGNRVLKAAPAAPRPNPRNTRTMSISGHRLTLAEAITIAKRGRRLLRAGRITAKTYVVLDCLLWSCRNPVTGTIVVSYTALQKLCPAPERRSPAPCGCSAAWASLPRSSAVCASCGAAAWRPGRRRTPTPCTRAQSPMARR